MPPFFDEPDIDPLTLVRACDAYYKVPKSRNGTRHGPLVGYAGTYEDAGEKKHYVGEEFINFAKIERKPQVLREVIVPELLSKMREHGIKDKVLFAAAPMGGIVLAAMLASARESEFGYPDIVEVSAATPTSRAVKELRYGRHEVEKDSRVVIVEDVCNNFSTTGKFIDLLHSHGAQVEGIVCFLNRSTTVEDSFVHDGAAYPVIAFWRQSMPEYRQDDSYVARDVARGRVIWKPKDHWYELPM